MFILDAEMAATSSADHAMCNQRPKSDTSKRIQAHYRAVIACGGRFSNSKKRRTREEVEASIWARWPKNGKPCGELALLLRDISSTDALCSSATKPLLRRHDESSSKDSDSMLVAPPERPVLVASDSKLVALHKESSSKDSDSTLVALPERPLLVASEPPTSDVRDSAFRNYVLQQLPMSRYDQMISKELPSLFDSGTNHAFEVSPFFFAFLVHFLYYTHH